jgi:hypothetical protein
MLVFEYRELLSQGKDLQAEVMARAEGTAYIREE